MGCLLEFAQTSCKMRHIWSYILMALCITVTSARVMDFPGNRNDLYDNVISGPEEEKVLAPPSAGSLNIDSKGFPGNSNDNLEEKLDCQESCSKRENMDSCKCNLSELSYEVLSNALNTNELLNQFEIIPFNKQDIINLKDSELCEAMCNEGIENPPCECNKQ